MATAVIVWEYCKDDVWINFDRHFSDMIEESFSKGYRGPMVLSDQHNTGLKFFINLFEMTLIITYTRDSRTYFMRRNVYNGDSLPGKGIFWQWFCKNTKNWKDYDLNVATIIEDVSRNEADYRVDISLHYPLHNVIVDLKSMTQHEKTTGATSSIQRIIAQPYTSKQVSTTPLQYPPTNLMPQQQMFSQSMQAYNQMPPNMSMAGITPMLGHITSQGFTNSSVPSQQMMCTPNSALPQIPTDSSMGIQASGNNRKHSHAFRYDMGYSSISPNYYTFPGSSDVDASSQVAQCKMPSRSALDGAVQTTPQTFPLYIHPSNLQPRKPTSVSGSRKRGRDSSFMTSFPSSSTAGKEHKNIIRAENCSTTFSDLMKQGFVIHTQKYPTEDCTICFNSLSEKSSYCQSNSLSSTSDLSNVVFFKNCHHHFHLECLKAMYESGIENGSIQCPQCKAIYGIKRGNCPSGEMSFEFWATSLPGYEDCGTIFVKYHISGGIQGPDHPNPGRPYSTRGFPRCGYLPNNSEGQKVLKLLTKAWKRRLTFTVGCSVTTGEADTVVWNEIHHKTEERNVTGHGYPDPNYLKNVIGELACHGVIDSDDE